MIKVNNISKTYLVWKTPFSRLFVPVAMRVLGFFSAAAAQQLLAKYCQQVHALDQVSFTVESGDSLGIIGLNGSGKSTLLQIIAGTLQPTTGSVEIYGRVAALLELGSGFDPEFTGRENVFLNGLILGLTSAEIEARFADIIAFADIGDFIDRPVKTYSSGMMVRLAFAVQVHVDPDVLIVDEALAVGDARFQAKALAKIQEILQRGTTLLFVGHDLSAVRAFCNRAMLLEKGKIIKSGIPDDVIADYLYMVQQDRIKSAGNNIALKRHENGFSASGFDIASAKFAGIGEHATLRYAADLPIDITISVSTQVDAPFLILDVVDSRGMQLGGRRIPVPEAQGDHYLRVNLGCVFQKGVYRIRMRLVSAPTMEQTFLFSKFDDLLTFEMLDDVRDQFTGLFPLPMTSNWINAQD